GCLNRAISSYTFRDLEQAERHLLGFRRFAGHGGMFFEVIFSTFLGPLIALERFRKTRSMRYRHRIKREMKKLNRLAREKGLNVVHRLFIVEAVHAATFPKGLSSDDIRSKFDKAIAGCRRPGYIFDAALAGELSGEYFLRIDDMFWAKHYLTEATKLYLEWGAKGKAHDLMVRHGSLIEISEKDGIEMSTTRKARHSMAVRVLNGSSRMADRSSALSNPNLSADRSRKDDSSGSNDIRS
ncbi:MAG: hypothetical protein SGILL_002057, partial [Bacillariaceae sp.]